MGMPHRSPPPLGEDFSVVGGEFLFRDVQNHRVCVSMAYCDRDVVHHDGDSRLRELVKDYPLGDVFQRRDSEPGW